MRIKNIKIIVEKKESGNKYNQILEFETLKRFENWIRIKKERGKLT